MFKLIFPPLLTVSAALAMGTATFREPAGTFLMWGYAVLALIFITCVPLEIRTSYLRWKYEKERGTPL